MLKYFIFQRQDDYTVYLTSGKEWSMNKNISKVVIMPVSVYCPKFCTEKIFILKKNVFKNKHIIKLYEKITKPLK